MAEYQIWVCQSSAAEGSCFAGILCCAVGRLVPDF